MVTLGKVKTKMKEKSTKHIKNPVRAPQNAFKNIFPKQEESLDNIKFELVQHRTVLMNTDLWDHSREMSKLSASCGINLFHYRHEYSLMIHMA